MISVVYRPRYSSHKKACTYTCRGGWDLVRLLIKLRVLALVSSIDGSYIYDMKKADKCL